MEKHFQRFPALPRIFEFPDNNQKFREALKFLKFQDISGIFKSPEIKY